jgi:hypothetical protein
VTPISVRYTSTSKPNATIAIHASSTFARLRRRIVSKIDSPASNAITGAMNWVNSGDQCPFSNVVIMFGSHMASGVRITYAMVSPIITAWPHARAPGSARSASRSH